MKIVSWNVNGFRSSLKTGFLDWFEAENPDLLSLQEVRVEWEELDLVTRDLLTRKHEVCWHPARSKKGYSGSATLSRKGLGFKHTRGIGIEAYDVEGRMIVSEGAGLTFIAGYFPNASAGLVRLPYKRAFAQDLAKLCKDRVARGENVVVVGDLNVAPEEIDLANPKSNRMTAGFTDEEREDFRAYLAAGLRDVFRERHPGEKGLYTWWSQRGGARAKNVGWRIDIFLVSEGLLPKVKDAKIHPDQKGSDHCPVSLELSL